RCWARGRLHRRRHRRDVGRRLAPAAEVGGASTGQDLTEALEAGDRAGGEEVVDVWKGGTHTRSQRLVARGPRERVQPDEPVAVPPQASALDGDERGVAAVPAI